MEQRLSRMSEEEKNIVGKQVDKTVYFKGEKIKERDVAVLRKPYFLEKDEFNILKKEDSGPKQWGKRFLFITIGIILLLISKVIAFLTSYSNTPSEELKKLDLNISSYELIHVGVLILVIGVLYLIGYIFKSERDKLIIRINKHFKVSK